MKVLTGLNLLTVRNRDLLEKLTGSQPVKKFPAFCGSWSFITACTTDRHLSLFCAVSFQSMSHPTSWRSTLILSSHLHPGLSSGLFLSGFPTKTLYTPLLSPIRATWPSHLFLLGLMIRIVFSEQYRPQSSSLCNFLHSPVTSSLLCPNILLSTLDSKHPSLRSPLSVSDQVSNPYKTRGKIIVLCILIFKFLDRKFKNWKILRRKF